MTNDIRLITRDQLYDYTILMHDFNKRKGFEFPDSWFDGLIDISDVKEVCEAFISGPLYDSNTCRCRLCEKVMHNDFIHESDCQVAKAQQILKQMEDKLCK